MSQRHEAYLGDYGRRVLNSLAQVCVCVRARVRVSRGV